MKTSIYMGEASSPPVQAAGWDLKIGAEHGGGSEKQGFGVEESLAKPSEGRMIAETTRNAEFDAMHIKSNGKSQISILRQYHLYEIIVASVLVSGCRVSVPVFKESADTKVVVDSNNAFALDIYHQLDEQKGNLVFSPIGIYVALGMTYAGARGQTEKEMAKALHITLPQQDIPPAFHKLLDWLGRIQKRDGNNLALAESLWPRKGSHFRDAFLELIRTNYDADVQPLDFGHHTAAAYRINAWAERKTGGMIKELVTPDQINPDTRLLLCSGIYFDGKWQTQFKPKDTTPMPFYVSSDQTVTVPMMWQFSKVKTANDLDRAIELLELPYSGHAFSMIIILQPPPGGLSGVERDLTAANLRSWLEKLDKSRPVKTQVSLPRFAFSHTFDLVNELKSLGISSAFNMKADFSGMDGTTNLFIADALNKAVLEVNEAGTHASAATIVHTDRKSMAPVFSADSPFVFLIRDNRTGCILFMGRVVNPLQH